MQSKAKLPTQIAKTEFTDFGSTFSYGHSYIAGAIVCYFCTKFHLTNTIFNSNYAVEGASIYLMYNGASAIDNFNSDV